MAVGVGWKECGGKKCKGGIHVGHNSERQRKGGIFVGYPHFGEECQQNHLNSTLIWCIEPFASIKVEQMWARNRKKVEGLWGLRNHKGGSFVGAYAQ